MQPPGSLISEYQQRLKTSHVNWRYYSWGSTCNPQVTVSPRDPDQGINKCEISHCPVPRVNLESGFKMKSVIITRQ